MKPLTALEGIWEGPGEGHYPTIEPFAYRERATFTRLGDKPILHYVQRTWRSGAVDGPGGGTGAGRAVGGTGAGQAAGGTDQAAGGALHAECGYLRTDDARVELVLAQPTGFTETHHGTLEDGVIAFGLTTFGRTATALPVQTVRRRWALIDDVLHVDLWMTWADVVDGHHLHAALRRAAT